MRSLSFVFSLLVCSLAVSSSMIGAQTAPIYLTFSVPYRLSKLHPEITSVRAVCEVPSASTGRMSANYKEARGVSVKQFVTGLKRGVDGSYSGEAAVNVTAYTYTTGSRSIYLCRMEGCVADGQVLEGSTQCAPFFDVYFPPNLLDDDRRGDKGVAGGSPDVRLKVSAPQPRYWEFITW